MLTARIKMVHVPCKGTAPALQDLIAGQVQVMFDAPSSMLPHTKAGKIKALAVASEKRFFAAPELPTLVESGVPVVGGTWVGILASAGTPHAIVTMLGGELSGIVKRADVRDRYIQLGIEPVGSSPEEFAQFLKEEVEKRAKVIRAANVKIEG